MPNTSASPNRPVFISPSDAAIDRGFVLTPGLVANGLWKGRSLGALIVAGFLVLAVVYIAFIRNLPYVATAVIEPPINSGSQLSGANQLFASFASVEGGGGASQFTKYLQVVGSTRFAERMEQDRGVMRILNGGWNPRTHSWTPPSGVMATINARLKAMLGMRPWEPPNIESLAQQLHGMLAISVVPGRSPLDLRSQVFSISVKARSPQLAYNLLSWTLRAADDVVREDQLSRTINRIAYLKAQIDSTEEVYLRQSLQQILMSQEEMLMTLHADKYYAFDLVDRPSVSNSPTGTPATTLLAIAAAAGLLVYVFVVVVLLVRRIKSPEPAESLRAPFPDPLGSVFGRLRAAFL
jgi:hypothetical protein